MTSIRKWIERILVPDGSIRKRFFIEARCSRCGEVVSTQVNLDNDLSILEDALLDKSQYYCRKVLVGQRCFQRIEVELFFDAQRNLIEKQVSGGQFTEV